MRGREWKADSSHQVVKIGVRGGWLETPSPGWVSHVRLSDAARTTGRLPIAIHRLDEGEGSEGAVLRELARVEEAIGNVGEAVGGGLKGVEDGKVDFRSSEGKQDDVNGA